MQQSLDCRICGRKFSKRGGIRHLCKETIADFARFDIDAEDMCMSCAMDKVKELSLVREERLGDLKAELTEYQEKVLQEIQVFTTPHPETWSCGIKGVVSGYAVIGVGAFTGLATVLTTVFLADSVDYGEWKTGRRNESVIFSMQTFVVKLASAISVLVAGVGIDLIGLDTEAAVQTAGTLLGLRVLMILVPIAGLLVSIFYFRKKYALTEEMNRRIAAELKERREQ